MNKKILIWIIVFFSTILLASGWYFGFTKYIDYRNIQSVEQINSLIESPESKETCKTILDFNVSNAEWNTKFKRSADFDAYSELNCE